jgi:hypothetical protein
MVLPILFTTIFNTVFSVQGFFRLANFGVFVALVVYLYRRYIKDFIISQMKAQAAVFEGLVAEQRDAIQMHDAYAQEVARAAQNQAHMQNMILKWHAAVQQERAAQALEKSSLLLARKQKAELLAQQLRKKVIAQRVMPEALLAARHELQDIFAQDQAGAKMVQRIMAHLGSGAASSSPANTELDSLSNTISGTRGDKS